MRDLDEEIVDCPDCFDHYTSEPYLPEALASVAISRSISTGEMTRRYFRQYHHDAHRNPDTNDT